MTDKDKPATPPKSDPPPERIPRDPDVETKGIKPQPKTYRPNR
jgi:hypothetical protein